MTDQVDDLNACTRVLHDIENECIPSCWNEEEEESDTDEEDDCEDLDAERRIAWVNKNVHEPRRVGDQQRAQFLDRADLVPPKVLRVIDVEASCSSGHVTLVDYQRDQVSSCGYSAISHTYGMDVYSIFNCQCACIFSSSNASIPPRCWGQPCPHTVAGESKDRHDRIVNDILQMCHILSKAGVIYAWHDGVCIAQHDDQEVRETIQSMGWIYSRANEIIVFLHYVGRPMAPISPRGFGYELVCRWHTRVWTLQEAALSAKRRYCVRVCKLPLRFCGFYRSCRTLKKLVRKMKAFEETLAHWYRIDTSEIDVITEERFIVDFIKDAEDVSCQLMLAAQRLKENHSLWSAANSSLGLDDWYTCIKSWFSCLNRLKETLHLTCLGFPTLGAALANCSRRNSKHMGDRMNSVLTLAGLKNFVAPKDFLTTNDTMEVWTLEFLRHQGQGGLAWALFAINVGIINDNEDMQNDTTCTWVPLLWRPLRGPDIAEIRECLKNWGIEFSVSEDRRLQLRGELLSVAMTFTLKLKGEKRIASAEHVAHEVSFDDMYVNKDLLASEAHVADENSDEAYMEGDEESFGSEHFEEEDLSTDEMYIDDGKYSDQQGSDLEEDDEIEGEHDEEVDEAKLEELAQHVKGRESLNLELNITVEGFIDSFLVRFPETNIIMGAATFYPVCLSESGDGRRIGSNKIEEGDSFSAYLLAPLHSKGKSECLIVQGNLDDYVSKIGIMTMFIKLTRIFQTEVGKASDYPAYKIIKELVVH